MTYQKQKRILLIIIYTLLLLSIFFIITRQNLLIFISNISAFLLYLYFLSIKKIKETTLCLIVKNGKVLMMLRNMKQGDVHINKYNGLGGKVEKGESHKDCVLREVYEEAGIKLKDYHYVGKVIFKNFIGNTGYEIMYTYCAFDYEGDIGECNEGELVWVDKNRILHLPLWEGDKYFLLKVVENKPFTAFLHYNGNKVVKYNVRDKHGSS